MSSTHTDMDESNRYRLDETICGYPTESGYCQNPVKEGFRCWLQAHDPPELTPMDYRNMSEQVAEDNLTDEQYRQWVEWNELDQQAKKNKRDLEERDEQAVETLIRSDMGELAESMSLYGNDLKVHLDVKGEDSDMVTMVRKEYEKVEDPENPDEADLETMRTIMATFFEEALFEFNGVRLDEMDPDDRETLCQSLVSEWGLRGSVHAFLDIVEATQEADEERLGAVESFRGAQRGGVDRSPAAHRNINPD